MAAQIDQDLLPVEVSGISMLVFKDVGWKYFLASLSNFTAP
jgi:hypothetical protein